MDVRLDRFEWVVFGCWDLLQRRSVYDDVDPIERSPESLRVTDIAEKEADSWVMAQLCGQVILLKFITTQDYQSRGIMLVEHSAHEAPTKRAGPTGDEDGLASEDAHDRKDTGRSEGHSAT
jgi:hypothetical protein